MASEIERDPFVVVMGGGSGSAALLEHLRPHNPTFVFNTSDNGGSTGRLVAEYGVMPMGDGRQGAVALSDNQEAAELFSTRLGPDHGNLEGHCVGNLIIADLELRRSGGFAQAIEEASEMLDVRGRVLPVSLDKHELILEHRGKVLLRGETAISYADHIPGGSIVRHSPDTDINPAAAEAISKADIIIIAPGNTYGSILPTLCVNGMREALAANREGRLVAITNLLTQPGHTDGWSAARYVQEYGRYVGNNRIDAAVFNTSPPSPDLLRAAGEKGAPVRGRSSDFCGSNVRWLFGGNFVAPGITRRNEHDNVGDVPDRSTIRHAGRMVVSRLEQLAA